MLALKEYLEDYAAAETVEKGEKLIADELEKIPNPKVKEIASGYLQALHDGKRDFRF